LPHRNDQAKAAAGSLMVISQMSCCRIWCIRLPGRASEYARAKSLTQHGGNCHGRGGDRPHIVAISAGKGAHDPGTFEFAEKEQTS
jgi:hypothetical protein